MVVQASRSIAQAPRSQRGFTVIELLCAFAVFSVLAVALVHTGHGQTQSMTRAFHETLALRLAQAELEATRTRREGLATDPGARGFALPPDATKLPGGRGTRTVQEIEPGLFEITVAVHWLPTGAEREATVQLTTRLADGGTVR